jgi:predicted nucleic acid-binding protein
MKEFFDTSVLVATFWNEHVHHRASIKRFAAAQPRHSACGVHSLAEVYAVMTALPVRPTIPPEQVLLFLEEIREHLMLVSLTPEEYITAIQETAARGFGSGRVYDALLLACASKCKAETIYTWNLRHYQALVPDTAYMASKIQTP